MSNGELSDDELEFEVYKLGQQKRRDAMLALLRADMERAKVDMQRQLDEAVFGSSGPELFQSVWLQPMPWWTRWFETAKYYVLNVWEALRGRRIPDTDDDY